MDIDYRGIRSLTARELIAALGRDGFSFIRQRGFSPALSASGWLGVTVAPHAGGDTFSFKTLKTIIEDQARWTEEDLVRLKLR